MHTCVCGSGDEPIVLAVRENPRYPGLVFRDTLLDLRFMCLTLGSVCVGSTCQLYQSSTLWLYRLVFCGSVATGLSIEYEYGELMDKNKWHDFWETFHSFPLLFFLNLPWLMSMCSSVMDCHVNSCRQTDTYCPSALTDTSSHLYKNIPYDHCTD